MTGNSTLDPDNFPDPPDRSLGTGHGTGALGPSDSSDSGSDLIGAAGLAGEEALDFDTGTTSDLKRAVPAARRGPMWVTPISIAIRIRAVPASALPQGATAWCAMGPISMSITSRRFPICRSTMTISIFSTAVRRAKRGAATRQGSRRASKAALPQARCLRKKSMVRCQASLAAASS